MMTYQDFAAYGSVPEAIGKLIGEHKTDSMTTTALEADEYDHQRNTTIRNFVQKIFTASGAQIQNVVASNNRRASNLFRRLNTQRCTYSLGNGVTFAQEGSKDKLGGQTFDARLKSAAYKSLIHGVSFLFLNVDEVYVFPLTEFAPLYDENTGALRAGVRYFSVAKDKPVTAVLYEEDGYSEYTAKPGDQYRLTLPKRGYIRKYAEAPADEAPVLIGEENYSALPIIPLWGSELHQSTLVGLKDGIDNYDLISNGWANDIRDCAQVYWLLENYGGMRAEDLAEFRSRLLYQHIATADTSDGGKITPYTQEIPYAARESYLNMLRRDIYADYGALDVSQISASAKTATEIRAAYQPIDENADDFEYQIITAVQRLLALVGVEDTPEFKRNRIANLSEEVEMVMLERDVLGDEYTLRKLPNVTPEEADEILRQRDEMELSRMDAATDEQTDEEPDLIE